MPGMTANITVVVQKIDSVLIVPGKALRFSPDAAFLTEYVKNNPVRHRSDSTAAGKAGKTDRHGYQRDTGVSDTSSFRSVFQYGKKPVAVWVKSGEKIHRTRIITGAVDGSGAEIQWGLKEGDEVILSMSLPGKSSSATTAAPATSPFMPQRRASSRR
jgi:HlyD family secretion protein